MSCSAAVSSGSAMGNMMHHVEREMQYRRSSGYDSVMGNNTGRNNVVDVRQKAKHQHRGPMQRISVILLC